MGVIHGDSTGHRQDLRPQAPRRHAFPSARPTRPVPWACPGGAAASPSQELRTLPPVWPGPHPLVPRARRGVAGRSPIIFPTGPHCSPLPGDGTLSCHRRRQEAPRQSLRHLLAPPPSSPGKPSAQPSSWERGDSRTTLWSPTVQLSSAGARAQAQEQGRPTLSREGSSNLRTLFLPLLAERPAR